MKLNNLHHEMMIDLVLSEGDTSSVMRSIKDLNINIARASNGSRIQPALTSGDVDRSVIRKILRMVTPAELEIIVTQFLGQNGLKVTKGRLPN
jgi:hypothetical protein